MYAEHQPQIEAWAKKNPENMVATYEFVVATVHRYFVHAPTVLATKHGFAGRQLSGMAFVREGRNMLYQNILEKQHDEVELMRYLITVPELGLPKAGFLAQLVTGQVGCLDTWNVKKYGIDKRILAIPPMLGYASVTKKLVTYVEACRALGGSARLWDTWCGLLASAYTAASKLYIWPTAEAVSQFHVDVCIR